VLFWSIAAALTLGAVAFLVPALRRGIGPAPEGRADVVKRLYRDRLAELEAERDAGLVADAALPALERELAGVLLEDYQDDAPARPVARGPAWWICALGVPLAAIALYLTLGEPQADRLRDAVAVFALDPEQDAVELAQWQTYLDDRVRRVPDDAQSWYLLGHTHLRRGAYAQAAHAFGAAQAVAGPDPSIELYWLQARYLAAGGELDDLSRGIAERLLAHAPDQPVVLEMLAVDAFRRGDAGAAVGILERALGASRDAGQREALEAGLAQAREQLGDLTPAIEVALAFDRPPPANATLFVIARPVGGGMPYAVVRRTVRPPPARVRLDDAVSMNPALPLSAAGQVEVVVRVSLAGTPTAHPGDWQWQSGPLELAAGVLVALEAAIGPPAPPSS
jgi:cytochrome c-type biogenesis protein CcmH